QETTTRNTGKQDVESVRQPLRWVPHQGNSWNGLVEPPEKVICKNFNLGRVVERRRRKPARLSQGDDVGDVLRSGAATVLLAGTDQQGRQCHASANIKGTDALRGVKLVARDRQQVDAQLINVHRYFSDRLCCIRMDKCAGALRMLG